MFHNNAFDNAADDPPQMALPKNPCTHKGIFFGADDAPLFWGTDSLVLSLGRIRPFTTGGRSPAIATCSSFCIAMDAETRAVLCVPGAKVLNDSWGTDAMSAKARFFLQKCCVKRHLEHPLHVIDAWDGWIQVFANVIAGPGTDTLCWRLDNALEEQVIQREALENFSEQQKEHVEGWKQMVHDWEEDEKKKNPYKAVVEGLTEMQVRLQFQQEEEETAKLGLPVKHKVTPSAFMIECLQVEEDQREVRVQAELKMAKTTIQQIDMGALCTKLIWRLAWLRKLQDTYSPASIVALEKQEALAEELPEHEPLFLHSALSEAERANGGCSEGLWEIEFLLRDAQCCSALLKLRNQLVIKARFLNYKRLHSRGQGATT
ncbi:CxC2 domain-containing protein [Mycena venus]|uniref:CxC2 domain-containing protein n=1 Tax=Mycena venus TaxID=2733690 RepID=A0A8H6YTN6_9AGAR|nr:CxC2 domain-containing protein [Mycena venus]